MTKQEATKIMALVATAYPTPAWTAETMDLYITCLGDLDATDAREHVMNFIKGRTESERPSIGEIRAGLTPHAEWIARMNALGPYTWICAVCGQGHMATYSDGHVCVREGRCPETPTKLLQ